MKLEREAREALRQDSLPQASRASAAKHGWPAFADAHQFKV
jgi:hypothetical protein